MAKACYIGVNNVARKVKSIYVGVGGIAKKVKKVYVGVGGVARECMSSGKSFSIYNTTYISGDIRTTNPSRHYAYTTTTKPYVYLYTINDNLVTTQRASKYAQASAYTLYSYACEMSYYNSYFIPYQYTTMRNMDTYMHYCIFDSSFTSQSTSAPSYMMYYVDYTHFYPTKYYCIHFYPSSGYIYAEKINGSSYSWSTTSFSPSNSGTQPYGTSNSNYAIYIGWKEYYNDADIKPIPVYLINLSGTATSASFDGYSGSSQKSDKWVTFNDCGYWNYYKWNTSGTRTYTTEIGGLGNMYYNDWCYSYLDNGNYIVYRSGQSTTFTILDKFGTSQSLSLGSSTNYTSGPNTPSGEYCYLAGKCVRCA